MPRLAEGVVLRVEQSDNGARNVWNVGKVVQSVWWRN
jgi:hypothetical protein